MTTVRRARPTSPGVRHAVYVKHEHLSKEGPFKPLTEAKKRTGGRNNQGRITTRHIGGGHAKRYRVIDFKRDKDGIVGLVERIEYDPNRSAHIALVLYADGERRYVIAPKGIRNGAKIQSGPAAPIEPGNAMPLANIPLGTTIHCIEMKPGKGAQMIRSAGGSAQLVGKESTYALIRLRSGEVRKILLACRATIGEVSNSERNLRVLGKAGRSRHLGIRPTVRGVAMNPIDHPHGGGEGKTSGGRHPVSFSGVPTKGKKTRKCKRTDNMIVRRRKKRK